MNSSEEKNISVFRDAVLEFFAPVAERHGLQVVAVGLTEYAIPLGDLTVRIRLIPSHVPGPVVALFSNDPRWIAESPLGSWGVSLLKFVQYREPCFDFQDERLGNRTTIPAKVQFLAELLGKYCDQVLEGDRHLWQTVSRQAEEEMTRSGQTKA